MLPQDYYLTGTWDKYKRECLACKICRFAGLLDEKAYPLFMGHVPQDTALLFVFEAPNENDTTKKGYLTVDPKTDFSGSFFYDLLTNELRFKLPRALFFTNSSLCLPKSVGGGRPVKAEQRQNCVANLQKIIDLFQPKVVSPIGRAALVALAQIEHHSLGRMDEAVARSIRWYGRVLFPLYHTSRKVVNSWNGRSMQAQREDWRGLRVMLDKLSI
jgi:uracil-DNA glycosylase